MAICTLAIFHETSHESLVVAELLLLSLLAFPYAHADDKAALAAVRDEGKKLEDAGKPKDAIPFYEKALELTVKEHGEDSRPTAVILNTLANVHLRLANYEAAKPLFERSLVIREKLYGKEHADVALVLNNLGSLNFRQRKYADAEPLYQRCLAIREKALPAEHPDIAGTVQNLANTCKEQGKLAEAEPLYRRYLTLIEKIHGHEHPKVASALTSLAILLSSRGKLDEAEPLLKRSLAMRESLLGKEHPDVADSLNCLALVYAEQCKNSVAEPLYLRSIALKETSFGKEGREVSIVLNNLALLYMNDGKFATAEPLLLRCAAIDEKAYGKDHPDVTHALNNLAILYYRQRNFAAAESLYRRSLAIREKSFGEWHPYVGSSLGNLANLYREQGKYAEAEALNRRTLAIQEKAYGKQHPVVGLTLNNLANVENTQGKYAEAGNHYERSLAIYEKAHGVEHPAVARSLVNLANLYKSQKNYAAAEPLYRRSLAIYEKNYGKEHPDVALVLHCLVSSDCNQQHFGEAARWETRLQQNTRQFLLRELPSLSVREQQDFLNFQEKERFTMALSLAYRQPADAAIAEASAAWLLNGKAIASEAQTINGRLEREIADPQGRAVLAEIQTIRSQEATLALRNKQPEAIAKQREELEKHRRELEKKLALRSSTAAKLANPWVELADVRARISADGVLIDIARFRIDQFDPRTNLYVYAPARYVAWVIPATGNVRIVDLGDAAKIDKAIQAARQTLEHAVDRLEKRDKEKTLETDAVEKLGAVAKLIFEPLKPHLGTATKLVLSPDGDLWLLPWAALPVAKERYLIEDYTLRFVVTGRDLVDDGGKKPVSSASLILADPDYNSTPTQVAEASQPSLTEKAVATRSVGLDTRGIGRMKRLPGTVAEAGQAFDKLKVLTGQEPKLYKDAAASEAIVKAAISPQVLVLATHGFFLKKQEPEPVTGGKEKAVTAAKDSEGKEVENPLLRCGLLLAGANKRSQAKEGEDDGVLTGLEIVGLDLRGTQMVVLSACETGVGDVQTGEGVAGLRQAFQLAGAECVLATLWQISDSATSQLMKTFYDELARGTERSEALTLAQRQFVKERRERTGAAHPYFWASFTLTGK